MGMVSTWWTATDEQIDELADDPSGINEVLRSWDAFDLDKAWHGLHFLLTGTAEEVDGPAGFIIAGGDYLSHPDDDYLIVRTLNSEEVRAFDEVLSANPPERLVERFAPAALKAADVYPDIWDEGEDALEYLMGEYEILRKGVREARERGVGLITYVG